MDVAHVEALLLQTNGMGGAPYDAEAMEMQGRKRGMRLMMK